MAAGTKKGFISRLTLIIIATAVFCVAPKAQSNSDHDTTSVYKYNICNGLSNQLLYHSASIAIAAKKNMTVEIPNHFIVNGVQTSDESVLPSEDNSVPFSQVFDSARFLNSLRSMGVKAKFVNFDFSKPQIPCAEMTSVIQADDQIMLQVLQAFQPSAKFQEIIDGIKESFDSEHSDAVCVHHRDGLDWHEHCNRWKGMSQFDGIYRGNCLGVPGRSFINSLKDRGLSPNKVVYYCGDHDPPSTLSDHKVVSWRNSMSDEHKQFMMNMKGEKLRDLYALIDFQVCSSIEHFIGNSVSSFSALQIALRDGNKSFWYNSQSVPLQDFWKIYQVPIVYTFTELSHQSGIHFLKASIRSVRKFMPNNKIHVLYHGTNGKSFREWLTMNKVIIHEHDPEWKDDIEIMRQKGDPETSHLFLHQGNYFGTWQRIDLPNFIENEYCLLLDYDTIITKPFTMTDFGLDITRGIAMSTEMVRDGRPANAGVMLMNIPRLRQTNQDFEKFIMEHVHIAQFDSFSPSDQGAYLDFYRNDIDYLDDNFNFKPYWLPVDTEPRLPFIVHFHGPKPHDYMSNNIPDVTCTNGTKRLCEIGPRSPYLCQAMKEFSSVVEVNDYCSVNFKEYKIISCKDILSRMKSDTNNCVGYIPMHYSYYRWVILPEVWRVFKRKFWNTINDICRLTPIIAGIVCLFIGLEKWGEKSNSLRVRKFYAKWLPIKKCALISIRFLRHKTGILFRRSKEKSSCLPTYFEDKSS